MEPKKQKQLSLKILITFIAILVLAVIVGAIIINNNGLEQQSTNLKVDDFSLSFLKMENNKQNMIYSPLSIKYALKMLSEGANGNTRDEIENIIGNSSVTKYDNIENILSLANSIYIRRSFTDDVKSQFKDTVAEKYNAEIKYDNFDNANNVNKWIEDKTFGLIQNMLQDRLVQDPHMKMLLINALAIDMEWAEKFDDSEQENFKLLDGTTKLVTMLSKEVENHTASYYKGMNVTAVAMDLKKYNDIQLEFMAIMPSSNLPSYIEKLTPKEINNISRKLKLASNTKNGLHIFIPKFKFDYELQLEDDLKALGINDAFNPITADFSNMSNKPLCVGEAKHKAIIDFKKEGIKAAAVTVIEMRASSATINKSKEIKIDKPFMFLIRDKETGEIWFTGAVYEPIY